MTSGRSYFDKIFGIEIFVARVIKDEKADGNIFSKLRS